MLTPEQFFDLDGCPFPEIFVPDEGVWTVLDRLSDYLADSFKEPWPLSGVTGLVDKTLVIHEGKVRTDCAVKPTGPKATVIGRDSEVRQAAYMRGNCLVGSGCVVGHTTEIKGTVMLDGAKAGHFAYLGDSVLGLNVNLGAGTKLANLRMIPGPVVVRDGKKKYNTGRRKLGAILGDGIETGCNSVTSPGTLMGPGCVVYPTVTVPAGYFPAKSVVRPPKGMPSIRSPRG
jgi:NDP-sugar pyrophosphorylase family protein